ncbi:hypothetical protein IFM89_014720 [Coptis chinensis]|uniref:Uncharacterized protein n=1 Tax=Coptis chinensis TaxID=261450 RepID=A0A835HD28_9MAGN|nr:hypothetical protein IFM89_014720 [Coptis chinensis]
MKWMQAVEEKFQCLGCKLDKKRPNWEASTTNHGVLGTVEEKFQCLGCKARLGSFNWAGQSHDISNFQDFPDHDGSVSDGCRQSKDVSSNKLLERLRKYGISGILSYGLLNTVLSCNVFLCLVSLL